MSEETNCRDFHNVVSKMREFFLSKGFVEVHPQSKLSILAACEDPSTMATYNYEEKLWPLPQTGQMWLEHYLLKNPNEKGFFCVSTSYRNEPDPVPGRHDKIFPMFEFEMHGGIDELRKMENELLNHLGFHLSYEDFPNKPGIYRPYPRHDYDWIAEDYGVDILENEHEEKLNREYGPVHFIENFPERTSPFWNMQLHESKTHANKIDVILHGMETIGSAERSTNPEDMRNTFKTISDGGYAQMLYDNFGEERVNRELDEFLSLDFFPRSGGGIGITRMIRAMKLSNLIDQ
jgi:aspartyl/asparaginyl-tRNA synthetase